MNNNAESQRFPIINDRIRETIPSEMQDIDSEKYRRQSAWNEVSMNIFRRAKEQQSYVFNLLRAYTRYWMQKATFTQGYLRWWVVCYVDWIRSVRLQKMVRQALDCGWSKNYRTQLQNPNFEPAPKGLFLITLLELDLWSLTLICESSMLNCVGY